VSALCPHIDRYLKQAGHSDGEWDMAEIPLVLMHVDAAVVS
jgi:hypothetical protein